MAETDQAPPEQLAPPEQVFANFQFEIYAHGLGGQKPKLPLAAGELQERARERLSPEAYGYGYVAGGAGSELTISANLRAFERWQIVPRMLRDVSERNLSTSLLGTSMPAPVLLAPVGVQSIVHPEAELAVGRAAAAHGLLSGYTEIAQVDRSALRRADTSDNLHAASAV